MKDYNLKETCFLYTMSKKEVKITFLKASSFYTHLPAY